MTYTKKLGSITLFYNASSFIVLSPHFWQNISESIKKCGKLFKLFVD